MILWEMLKGFVSKRITSHFPKKEPVGEFWGILKWDGDKCIYCGTCERVCPSKCIKVDREKKIWSYNFKECIFCGNCVEHCPVKALSFLSKRKKPWGSEHRQGKKPF